MKSQVVINEIMINPTGVFDGSGMPNTAEWVELYNSGATAVDLSCWILADGDFTVVFPAGSNIAAGGFFTLCSPTNTGLSPNLNWATCGCSTPAAQVGLFTNGGEQLILYNATKVIQDAVIWGAASPGGQALPDAGNATLAVGSCSATTVDMPAAATPPYEYIGSQTIDGGSSRRTTDGGATWVVSTSTSFGASNGTLPVELISFTGVSEGTHNSVSWKSAVETNFRHYELESSEDGVNFNKIATVNPIGNVSALNNYNYLDFSPYSPITYYRLKMVDLDYTFEYSNIISVENGVNKEKTVIVYPNPASRELYIKLIAPAEKEAIVSVQDIYGRVIFEEKINLTQTVDNTLINTSSFASGTYIVSITAGNTIAENIKVIITNKN